MHTFIIAEAGVNHNGSIITAKKLIDAAAYAGCDAVKFQTFITENIVTKTARKADYQEINTGIEGSQYSMLKSLELDYEKHLELMEYCKTKHIKFLSTPFDEESADMLENLGIDIFKIPSGEITNKHFLQHIARKDKPIILSTGMSTLGEVEDALDWIYETRNRKVTLLHCTSNYPSAPEEVNLRAMLTLKEAFKVGVGYSDHTLGIEVPIASVALGAEVLEKHFTMDRDMDGPDHKASIEPSELANLVRCIRNIEYALGDGIKKPSSNELITRVSARKSIVLCKSISKGEIITLDMLSVKRPGNGLEPKLINDIVGRIAVKDLTEDHILQIGDFV